MAVYQLADARVRFWSTHTRSLSWADASFGHWIPSVKPSHENGPSVYMSSDDQLSRQLLKVLDGSAAVSLDSGVTLHLDSFEGNANVDCLYVLFHNERAVLVLHPPELAVARTLARWTVRAMLRLRASELGWVPFHSAGCTLSGVGVCIAGPKRSGKTATLLNLLSVSGAGLVANDKMLLAAGERGLTAHGLPFRVAIRGPVAHALRLRSRQGRAVSTMDTLHMRMPEVAIAFNATPKRSIRPAMLIVPNFVAGMEQPELRESVLRPLELIDHYLSIKSFGQEFLASLFDVDDVALRMRLGSYLANAQQMKSFHLTQGEKTNAAVRALVLEQAEALAA